MDSEIRVPKEFLHGVGRFLALLTTERLPPHVEEQRVVILRQVESYTRYSNSSASVSTVGTPEEDSEEPRPGAGDDLPGYATLRAHSLKCGPLLRRERLVFLEQWRRSMAGLLDHRLLLFSSERDARPAVVINIQGYVARPAPQLLKDPKRRGSVFEILCPGKNDYQFIARTAKDMDQWVAAICQASVQYIQAPLAKVSRATPEPGRSTTEETYDDAGSLNGSQQSDTYESPDSVEEIYQDIPDVYRGENGSEDTPKLPPRRPLPSIPREDSLEGECLYDDIGANNIYSNLGTDVEEDIYDDIESVSSMASINKPARPNFSVSNHENKPQKSSQPGFAVGSNGIKPHKSTQPNFSMINNGTKPTEPNFAVRNIATKPTQSNFAAGNNESKSTQPNFAMRDNATKPHKPTQSNFAADNDESKSTQPNFTIRDNGTKPQTWNQSNFTADKDETKQTEPNFAMSNNDAKPHKSTQPNYASGSVNVVRNFSAQTKEHGTLHSKVDGSGINQILINMRGDNEEVPSHNSKKRPPAMEPNSLRATDNGDASREASEQKNVPREKDAIRNRIKQLELTLPGGGLPIGGQHPGFKPFGAVQPNESNLHKNVKGYSGASVSSIGADRSASRKPQPSLKPNTSNLHKPTLRNPPSYPQPPKLPPRSVSRK